MTYPIPPNKPLTLNPSPFTLPAEMSSSSSSSSSSSGEEDGDAEWKAAIDSVSSSVSFSSSSTSSATTALNHSSPPHRPKSQSHLKHYQIKAQQMLNDILDNTIQVVVVSSSIPFPFPFPCEEEEDSADNGGGGGGIQLFKHAPSGIVFDHIDEVQQPNKKPRLLPGKEIDEKSKKFKQHLQSVVVDGIDIIAAARDAAQKSLATLEAREVVAKAAAKREEERVAELKKIRGERWLPCMPPKGGYF